MSEKILKLFNDNGIEAGEISSRESIQKVVKAIEENCKKQSSAFYEWASALSPVNKISVYGRGGGFGPINLTSEELYDNFLRWQKKQSATPEIKIA